METASVFGYSKLIPFGFSSPKNIRISLRPFSKHGQVRLQDQVYQNQKSLKTTKAKLNFSLSGNCNFGRPLYSHSMEPRMCLPRRPVKCSYSNATSPEPQRSLLESLKGASFDSLKAALFRLTPIDICKLSLVFAVLIAAGKGSMNLLFNPFVWMYFSWSWLFWPWFVAIGVAIYGAYCLRKHILGEANEFEQLAIVTSVFTWLTLVPPALFNGYLEGWPYVFFFVYHYFFFLNVSVRKRMYGDHFPRQHDSKWDVSPPNWCRLLFCVGVMVGHWFAAFEGPELHLIPGGRNNLWVWGLIMLTIFAQYNSTLYLAKYSEKVVVPTTVVKFGPYRWVRHPIYASTMLLFVSYFAALRAPISSLYVIVVCLMYYEQKAKLEEALMTETFGTMYKEYMDKVRFKFIPFVY